MPRRLLLLLCLLSVLAIASISSDDSTATICNDIKVHIQNADGTYDVSVVEGVSTVMEAVESAMADQGKAMVLNSRGNISSVNGLSSDDDRYWRIYQWLPMGTSGWGVVTFSRESDGLMMTGATYCINLSSLENADGTVVYSVPTFRPVSTGYVFIRFANGFNPGLPEVRMAFTPEIRGEGFWLEGRGSSLGEVLENAVSSNGFDIITHTGSSGGNDLSFWITSMFGLGDENLGDGAWAYWSQWTWMDGEWGYNDWTLGYYDPGVFPYVECIYLISTPDPYGDGYGIDKGGPEPNPDEDEIQCITNYHTVRFIADGEVVSRQNVPYGASPIMSIIGEAPEKQGFVFAGWGDVSIPITVDTDFEAVYVPLTPEKHEVIYYLHDGLTVLHRELVDDGHPASYDGAPSKPEDERFTYAFDRWSLDLTDITSDVSVTPVYIETPKLYEVIFHDHDRSLISTRYAEYGTQVDTPTDPSRDSTIRYQYVFTSWSITPNGNSPANLDSVTKPMNVFAYYAPVARPYTVSFYENGSLIASRMIGYGSNIGSTIPCDIFAGEAIVKMYRDPSLSTEYATSHVIIGDTDIHIKRIAGGYDSHRDSSGIIVSNRITVSFDPSNVLGIDVVDGGATICDLSQFTNGTTAVIGLDSLQTIMDAHGDIRATIVVPRGSITMSVSEYISIAGNEDSISFSVAKGPVNVKMLSALKRIDSEYLYSAVLKAGNSTITDLHAMGITAELSLQTSMNPAHAPGAWSVTSKGATDSIQCDRIGNMVRFNTDLVQYFAVGTTDRGVVMDREQVVTPYGDMDYTKGGSNAEDGDPDTIDYNSTIESMALDNLGGVLFIPSIAGGYPVKTVSFAALNSVSNAPIIVLPATVSSFSWENWSNTGITDVYFLGDRPDFSGSIPPSVTVHRSPSGSGWDSIPSVDDVVFHIYNGSYGKHMFCFTYYLIGDEIVIHRYVSGTHVCIPDAIAVNGTEHPVRYIGDSAFMRTANPYLHDLFDLSYSDYTLTEIDLGQTVTGILTGAFSGSTVRSVLGKPPVTHYWDECFRNCTSLTNMTISDKALFIGESAFRGCTDRAFTLVTIPDSVEVLGAGAFYGCTNLVSVKLGTGLSEIPDDCFGFCGSLCDMILPENITIIGSGSFYNAVGLQYVDLGSITSIGANAFNTGSTNRLEYVILGEGIMSIGDGAFGNCTSLMEVEAHCIMPSNIDRAFNGVDLDGVTFYVSSGAMESWSSMANVKPMVSEEEEIPESHATLYITIGLMVFFIILGAISIRMRSRLG